MIKTNPDNAYISWAYPNNWTEKYGIFCDKSKTRDTAKTIVLVENTIICLLLLTLTDILGRKTIVVVAGLLMISGMTLNAFMPNIYVKMVGMGLGFGAEGTFSALFSIIINENTRKYKHLNYFLKAYSSHYSC